MVADRLLWLAFGLGVSALLGGCLDRRAEDQAANAEPNQCTACHGSSARAGSPLSQSAPPNDLSGNTESSAPGVGSHQIHLVATAGHRAIECGECHTVPRTVQDPGHIDGKGPAKFVPGALASFAGHTPKYDATTRTCSDVYCHLEATPKWTAPRADACGTCHGVPPAAPHPQSKQCYACHSETVDAAGKIVDLEKHLDGKVEVAQTCHSCHGTPESPAPPRDVAGETDPSKPGVGAHQKHLAGGSKSRPVECKECHVVPATVEAPGHFDTALPAELTFSGIATAGAAKPAWDGVKCTNTYCHSTAVAAGADMKGAVMAPQWTKVDGTQVFCGSCHGIPPIEPDPNKPQTKHPIAYECPDCHKNLSTGFIFKDPSLHVNGKVDMTVGVDL